MGKEAVRVGGLWWNGMKFLINSLVILAFFKEFRLIISHKYYTYSHCLLPTSIIQPLRFSQNALWLTNITKDYKHRSASSPTTDRLLALHIVFDIMGHGAQRRGF